MLYFHNFGDFFCKFIGRILALGLFLSTSLVIASSSSSVQELDSNLYKGSDLSYTNLEELGLPDGYTFDGLNALDPQEFWFPIPQSIKVKKGDVWLHYLASSTLTDKSLIRIDVNGQPRTSKAVSLNGRDTWIRVPLKEKDFTTSEHLKLTIRPSLLGEGNRCFGELLPANFLHILPDTAITVQLPQRANSIARAWELLGKQVSISIPQEMTTAQYNNALQLTMNLLEQGKKVRFVQFPVWADIMLVNKIEMQDLLNDTYHSTLELQKIYGNTREYLKKEQNINYLNLPDRSAIILSEPFEDLPATLTSWQWPRIAKQTGYRVYTADADGDKTHIQEQKLIPLKNLGLDMATRFATPKVDWQMVITPEQLPANSQLERLQMSVTSAPSNATLPPLFYVYLNNVLQQAVRLNNDGLPTKFTVMLGKSEQNVSQNHLRFVTQRSTESGDCSGSLNTFPVQINPDSALIIDSHIAEIEKFVELPSYFSDGFDIFLPESILRQPAMESLNFLGNLLLNNNYPYDHKRLHFYSNQQELNFDKPFILFGDTDLELDNVPVELSKGRIQVKDYNDKLLLDLEDVGNITIFQITRSSDNYGLWIIPPKERSLPIGSPILLVNDDVGFADSSGMLMTLNSKQRKISAIDYPEYRGWFDVFDAYRYWLMGLGWLLITLLVVHLYNKAAAHKRHEKSGDA